MDGGVDSGVVVAQSIVQVHDEDTVVTLTERIKSVERPQLVEYVGRMAREGFTVAGRRGIVGRPAAPAPL